MKNSKYLLTVLGMSLVTYGTRFLPLYLFKDKRLKQNIIRWMKYVPITILGAIIAPDIFMPEPEGALHISFKNPYLVASIITMFTAFKVKNLVAVMAIGMTSILILKTFVII